MIPNLKDMATFKQIPELTFILKCIQNKVNAKEKTRIKSLANSNLNWDLVFEIAIKQRVLPILYKKIQTIIPGIVPDRIFTKFKNAYFNNTTRNLYLLSFLISCINILEKNNIKVLPFKGIVLAQDIYGDIALRSFSDIDILVNKENASKAWSLLLNNQFKPQLTLTEDQKKKYILSEDHIAFSKGKMHIELHWEMSGLYLSNPLTFEHVEKRLTTVHLHNKTISNLSPEDLLVYLCIHGTKHGWEYIEQVLSIAELIRINKDIDWNYVEKLVQTLHCKKMYSIGIFLSWKIFKAPLPEYRINELKNDQRVIKLSRQAALSMFENITGSKIKYKINRFSLFHLMVRDSFTDMLRYGLRLIFRPTDKEWFYFPVPGSLSFLHYFLRPYRLLVSGLSYKYG